jgi:hypothetical protein
VPVSSRVNSPILKNEGIVILRNVGNYVPFDTETTSQKTTKNQKKARAVKIYGMFPQIF